MPPKTPQTEGERILGMALMSWGFFQNVGDISDRTVKDLYLFGFMNGYKIGVRDAIKYAGKPQA